MRASVQIERDSLRISEYEKQEGAMTKDTEREVRYRRRGDVCTALMLLNVALAPAASAAGFITGNALVGTCFALSSVLSLLTAWRDYRSRIAVHVVEVSVSRRAPRNVDRFDDWKEALKAFYDEDRKSDVPGDCGMSAAFMSWLFKALDADDKAK